MRVLMISPFGLHDRGGMGRLLVYLTQYWNHRPDSPSCLVVDSRGLGPKISWPFNFAKACIVVLRELVRRRIDVAHLHLASHGSTLRKMLLVQLIARFHVPIVLHLHGGNFDEFWETMPAFFQHGVRRMFWQASQVIVLGTLWKDFVCRRIGMPSHRVHILRNAVPGPVRLPSASVSKPRRILFLGRLEPNKGIAELLEALASLAVRNLPWDAVLAGSGDLEGYRSMARVSGIEGRVTFPGWVSTGRVRELLEQADILVLPSHFEGLSMAILEGMAYGLAVVATPVGSIPEAVTHGESGLLVPVKDPAALAKSLELVLRDDSLRIRLGQEARRRFLADFEIGQYAGKIVDIYRQCGVRPVGSRAHSVPGRVMS